MKTKTILQLKTIILLISLNLPYVLYAQQTDTTLWSLSDCINYALQQNIEVRGSELNNKSNEIYYNQAKWDKYPSVSGSVSQNFNWKNSEETATGTTSFSGNNSTNYSVSSNVTLYNGLKLNNNIRQAEINLESGKYSSETIKENISLQILDAFLQVLYTNELVKNTEKQIEATTGQLQLAEERLSLSIISRSDYLQVKSELASEKLTLANAKSSYEIARISLMQLMELPVDKNFDIVTPEMEDELNQLRQPDAASIYQLAIGIKPQVKSAELNTQSALYDEKIAKADFYPTVSANAGLGTGYSSLSSDMAYFSQLDNSINPSLGLSVSIPIFQKNQVKNNIKLAKIGIENAGLNEIDVKNQLRKSIEQACVDVTSAQTRFEASKEKYEATEESYALAEEKFKNGLINSVDFLIEKTNLIEAESDLLQSKYNIIFSYKILDFYAGIPLSL